MLLQEAESLLYVQVSGILRQEDGIEAVHEIRNESDVGLDPQLRERLMSLLAKLGQYPLIRCSMLQFQKSVLP